MRRSIVAMATAALLITLVAQGATAAEPAGSAAAPVKVGGYSYAAWITGPFAFDGHAGAYRDVFVTLWALDGKAGSAADTNCVYYANTVYIPGPDVSDPTILTQTSLVGGCTPGDVTATPSLDAVALPTTTIETITYSWADGVASQPVIGTATLSLRMTAAGQWDALHSKVDPEPAQGGTTRSRPADAEFLLDGVDLGPPTFASIGWSNPAGH